MNIDEKEKGNKKEDEHSKKPSSSTDDAHKKPSEKVTATDTNADTAHGTPEKRNSATPSASTTVVKKQRAVWKKPKDMPKRPLSAYNIFFQLHRKRIVEQGYITSTIEQPSTDEMVRTIEDILQTSREKKRPGSTTNNTTTPTSNKKSKGKIGFGNLARTIADSWKTLDPQIKSIYDHYAQFEMIRYKRELKAWKDKKETEAETRTLAQHADFVSRMNNSASSGISSLIEGGKTSYHELDTSSQHLDFADERSINSEPWNLAFGSSSSSVGGGGGSRSLRGGNDVMNDDFNNSFSSLDSSNNHHASSLDLSDELESEPMRNLVNRQQQILQQLREESSPTNLPLHYQFPPTAGTATFASAAVSPPQTTNMATMMQRHLPQQNMPSTQFGGVNQNYMQQQTTVLGMHQQPQMTMQSFHHHQSPAQVAMGGFNHWNSSIGNASLNSLQSTGERSMESSIFNPPSNDGFGGSRQLYASINQVSDNSSSQYNDSGISQSSSSGFNNSFSTSAGSAAGFQNRAAGSASGVAGAGNSGEAVHDRNRRSPGRPSLFNREVEGGSGQPK